VNKFVHRFMAYSTEGREDIKICVCVCFSAEYGFVVSERADDAVSAFSAAGVRLQLSLRTRRTRRCSVQRCTPIAALCVGCLL